MLLMLGLVAAPAHAAGKSDCSAGDFCVWVHADYDNGPFHNYGNISNYTDYNWWSCPFNGNFPPRWNDCASSAYNNGNSCGVRFYADAGYTGASYYLSRGVSISNLTNVTMTDGAHANDRISSHKWIC